MKRLPTWGLLVLAGCGDGAGADGAGGETTSTGTDAASGTGPTGATTGAGTGGEGGGGGPPAGLVPMFVAQGHVARTILSCDDGQSWIEDQSDDDTIRCFESGFDCDHHPGAANGIVWHDGAFFATFGWGMPGGVRRSRDGIAWEEVLAGTTFGGLAAGAGRVIGAARTPSASVDGGDTWTDLPEIPLQNIYNVRESTFAPYAEGRFVLVGNDGDARFIAVSSNGGDSFDLPAVPAACNISFYRSGGIAFGAGAIVVSAGGPEACLSTDGGGTWSVVDVGGTFESSILWSGGSFWAWGGGQVFTSADGAAWASQPMTPGNVDIGPAAVSPGGTFVAVRAGWNQWYDSQRFYRSTDGVSWTEVAAGSFSGGHPIVHVAFGYGEPSASCPR